MRYSLGNILIIIFIAVYSPFMVIQNLKAEQQTIVFASEEWKDATNRDGTGLYWDILRAVYEPEGYQIKPIIRSYSGSVTLIKDETVDGMIGAYIDEIEDGLYPQNHFAVDIVQALYKKNSGIKWDGVDTMKGRKLAWIEGYSYNEYLPDSVMHSTSLRRVDTRKLGIRLLLLSKIDFFLDAEGDLKDFFIENKQFKVENFVAKTILELKLYTVFAQNEEGKILMQLFDQNFSKLLKKGRIKKLYKKYSDSNFTMPSNF